MTTLKLFDIISRKTDILPRLGFGLFWVILFVATLGVGNPAFAQGKGKGGNEPPPPPPPAGPTCSQTITANVVVFDNPTVFNRLGAQNPNWITYALKRDVVHSSVSGKSGEVCQLPDGSDNGCQAGMVELRPDKRPRPLVVRSVEGACLNVNFTNWLDPTRANPNNPQQGQNTLGTQEPDGTPFVGLNNDDQVAGRCASFQATGTELVNIKSQGAWVGANPDAGDGAGGPKDCGGAGSGLAAPGDTVVYNLYTPHEGAYIISSYGATIGSEANSGNLAVGMFGALNVQPKGAKIYRSQVTEEELRLATTGTVASDCVAGQIVGVDCNPGGQPVIDYEALYPNVEPWKSEGKAGLPIINMLTASGELVHSDINAIIAGGCADGSWKCTMGSEAAPYPLERKGFNNPVYPNRLEAFREFTSQYHDEQTNSQVFPNWYNHPTMRHVLHGVKDQFMINYGSGGIGSEIISNRLRAGPMHDCTDCAYEEFFLASQTVGDPAMLVNYPANTGIEACSPENIAAGPGEPNSCWRLPGLANGPVQLPTAFDPVTGAPTAFELADNYALFQEDPSNVHHAYTGDHVKMRNTHAGSFEQHIFHFHNHQWLFNPNDDNANYLDAQEIMPGSGHTYELVNGGAGNRNKTVGDAIFHCHFYPHFAQGMWYHMRNHDVFEAGTVLAVSETETGFHLKDANNDGKTDWALRSGKPAAGARALPDGELPDGSPIPAIVPLPGKAMPQMPARVSVAAVDRGSNSLLGGRLPPDPANPTPDSSQAIVDRASVAGADGVVGTADDLSPGFPFWLAGNECGPDQVAPAPGEVLVGANVCPMGIVGQRMPTPPLDMLTEAGAAHPDINPAAKGDGPDWSKLGGGWDGGLPRHAMLGYTAGGVSKDTQNRLDFAKIIEMTRPVYFPEVGTDLEQVSMEYQSHRLRPSAALDLNGNLLAGEFDFVLNGAKPVPSGPFNDPCVDDNGTMLRAGDDSGHWFDGDGSDSTFNTKGKSEFDGENPRTYKLANLQIDAVFNKVGYHYSQERIIILWDDVKPTVLKERPPEPLVMRFNTFDCGKILHANLVPAEFEVDDFQVRTPTDIIGQHIHLPKWDLTSNDGAANGWNYEDGTLSPKMVEERIFAINRYNGLIALGAACVADPASGASFADPTGTKTFTCAKFDVSEGRPVLKAGSLPGQLGPVDLTGLVQVASLTDEQGADPGAISAKGATQLFPTDHYFAGFTDPANPQVGAGMYHGARTTIQRILVDPVVNVNGVDRGLGLTFSHDHYGPSTFQQIGLYSTILAEPAHSTWVHNEHGDVLGGQTAADIDGPRNDGGPTSWQAAILPPSAPQYGSTVQSENIAPHREFYFEMSDFQHAYEAGVFVGADVFGIPTKTAINQPDPFNATVAFAPALEDTWLQVVNPTLKLTANGGANPGAFPDTVNAHPGCPGRLGQNDPNVPRPCAEAINIGHASTWVVNYRNEPVGLRVFDPSAIGPDGRSGTQAAGKAGDLAFAFQTRNDRAISALNTSLGYLNGIDGAPPYPAEPRCAGNGRGDGINCDRQPGDPFTPIMRAYEGDEVKIKIQVGATEEQHLTTVHGIKWLSNGSGFGRSGNSGWRNFQSHGISEQFSLQAPFNRDPQQRGNSVDYMYAQDATRDGIWSGTWGILRTYNRSAGQSDLVTLPGNGGGRSFANENQFNGVCPKVELDQNGDPVIEGKGKGKTTPVVPVQYSVAAVLANEVLPNNLGVTITPNTGGDSDGDGLGDNVGGPLNTAGGTLVYNRRGTVIPGIVADGNTITGGAGPLNDPTAMMYVRMEDLEPRWIEGVSPDGTNGPANLVDDRCEEPSSGEELFDQNVALEGCPVKLKATAPVEPLVLRASAGDCIEVTLSNKLIDQATVNNTPVYEYMCTAYDAGIDLIMGTADDVCVADEWFAAFDAEQAQDALDQGYTLRTKDDPTPLAVADVAFDAVPDLAGWLDTFWVVNRDLFKPVALRNQLQMSFFGNNLIRPSAQAGLHAQLVSYDTSRDEAILVGNNNQEAAFARPGGSKTYQWYAGDLRVKRDGNDSQGNQRFRLIPTPIEFGASNLLSSDRVKQPQKGLFGALVIEPAGTTVVDETTLVADGQGNGGLECGADHTLPGCTRLTRAQATVSSPTGIAGTGGEFREAIAIVHKLGNLRWKDGSAIKNVHQAEFGVEGAEDSGHAGFNYGAEPSWFRFKLPPDAPFGNAGTPNSYGSIQNPQAMYSNALVATEPNAIPDIPGIAKAGDMQTPVFRAQANRATGAAYNTRMYVLNGASADRDSTFILTGHTWPRDPYVCTGAQHDPAAGTPVGAAQDDYVGIVGRCDPWAPAPSNALGFNEQAKYMGSEEGMGHVFSHWPIFFDAGGSYGVKGDYLYRDYTPNGNRNGLIGILRVE
ncbi:MAG TPA: hypothetical protein VLS87_09055 [Woeseiaceae bacterium]|nr:hypothetical protein [Woeseiaceae bacterium]